MGTLFSYISWSQTEDKERFKHLEYKTRGMYSNKLYDIKQSL